MAKLPALVNAVMEVDGRERKTIDHFARTIREAGHIPTSKRGSGSSEMTINAAANLIIGLNSSEAPKDAPKSIATIRPLKKLFTAGKQTTLFPQIDEAATFGEALEALIANFHEWWQYAELIVEGEATAEGKDQAYQDEKLGYVGAGKGTISISVKIGHYHAEICFENLIDAEKTDFQKETVLIRKWCYAIDPADKAGWQKHYVTDCPDRSVNYRFGLPTIAALWSVISGEPNPAKAAAEQLGEIKLT